MSDKSVIQIDDDWKRQAQEEKRKLAEKEAAAKKPAPAAPARRGSTAERSRRALPKASFATLIQSTMTQALYYLGELAAETAQPALDLDMAKHHIDVLGILEEKTRGNLTPDEQSMLDQTLYDLRSRFVSVASQFIQ